MHLFHLILDCWGTLVIIILLLFVAYDLKCRNWSGFWWNLRWIGIWVVALTLFGCATHSPDLPVPGVASTGPNGNHSGVVFVVYRPDGSIKAQGWIEKNRTEYNALIAVYGTQFIPPLKADDGLTKNSGYWEADDTAISNYIALLNLKRKAQVP